MGLTGVNPGSITSAMPWSDEDGARRFRDIERRLEQMFADGTLIALVNNLPAQIYAVLAAAVNTGTITTTSDATIGGNATIAGAVNATGVVTGTAGLNSPDVYGHLVTYGLYHATWTNIDGTVGYAPSSARFKQEIVTASLPDVREVMRRFRITQHRYIAAVEAMGDAAPIEWGPIAEEVDELGLTWLVDYDEDGLPIGVKHERIASLLVLDSHDKQSQIDALADRVLSLENAYR